MIGVTSTQVFRRIINEKQHNEVNSPSRQLELE